MATVKHILFIVLAPLILASCLFEGSNRGGGATPEPEAILQFQSSREELRLESLRMDQKVYSDVRLRLARDGTWQLESIGWIRPLAFGESAQAVLTAPGDATLDKNWRPDDATITIRRIHIDTKVFGNIPLRLTGNNWFWGHALQAEDDLQDAHELKALTLADYRANSSLAASETHHTVLHAHADSGTQRFPMRLGNKLYRFCMAAQDDGADGIRLLDPAGNAVVDMKAGDACVDIKLDVGLYTMEHVYVGSGAKRTIFIHPATTPSPPAVNVAPGQGGLATGAQDDAYPEYWAVYVPELLADGKFIESHSDGFLGFNGGDYGSGCVGAIDAAAQIDAYARIGDPEFSNALNFKLLFRTENFFRVIRNGGGVPSGLSYPLSCPNKWFALPRENSVLEPVLMAANSLGQRSFVSSIEIRNLTGDQFNLVVPCTGTDCDSDIYVGFRSETAMHAMDKTYFNELFANGDWHTGAAYFSSVFFGPEQLFQVHYRYFPKGIPPSARDSTGSPIVAQGEVGFFSGSGCTGAAMFAKTTASVGGQVLVADWLPNGNNIGNFAGSVVLGPNTTATADFPAKKLNQTGCLDNQADLAESSYKIEVTTTINIATNSCEYCNLAGIDLSNRTTSLIGVKLQHANLSWADFANSNLTQADLRNATLQGANLSNTNLESANLCQATLNAGTTGTAAQLSGAHLKNVNLSGANLDGANFVNASFYSSTQGPCQSSCSDAASIPNCASAYLARIDNTDFSYSYLANVDMSGVSASGAKFTGAILFGARLIKADLNSSAAAGTAASFAYAFLQGADFTDARLKYVNFDSAYVDADKGNNCMQIKLRNEITGFPGFTSPTTTLPVSCIAKGNPTTDIAIPSCISVIYPAQIPWPATDMTNICPDGNTYSGGCTAASWTAPRIMPANSSQPNKTCQARLCNAFTENTCWN